MAPGQRADLIATDGNLLADIKQLPRVKWVMTAGVVYRGSGERGTENGVLDSTFRSPFPVGRYSAFMKGYR